MNPKRFAVLSSLLSLLLLTFCTGLMKKQPKQPSISDSISDKILQEYVRHLSSEDYAGRLTGTREYESCAQWAVDLFKKWGLEPAGDRGTYLQKYSNPYTLVFVGGELSRRFQSGKKRKYIYEKEYYPGSHSGSGRITAEVVYAGFGITAPELSYDDYVDVNVKGKIVLMEPGIPVSRDNPQIYKEWRPYSDNQYKVKMAVAQGAKGMLLNQLAVIADSDYVHGFMVAHIGDTVVNDIFKSTGKSHKDTKMKIMGSLKPQSFRTQKLFTIENLTEHYPHGKGYNILGLLEGSDPELKKEVIIIGANLDHVGFCYEVIPGANDNASGIAVLLGITEMFYRYSINPQRSLLFICFGSKEQALRGSKAYLSSPVFSKRQTIAFINLDMVGCGDQIHVYGAKDHEKLWKCILKSNKKTVSRPLHPQLFPTIEHPAYDASMFFNAGIPSLIITVRGAPTYPHTTRDTAETITPGIMEDLTIILFRSLLELANSKRI